MRVTDYELNIVSVGAHHLKGKEMNSIAIYLELVAALESRERTGKVKIPVVVDHKHELSLKLVVFNKKKSYRLKRSEIVWYLVSDTVTEFICEESS